MNALISERIRAHATKLALPELAENLTELAARADQSQLGYLDFLDQLLEDEVAAKESRRFRNALHLSGLPHHRGRFEGILEQDGGVELFRLEGAGNAPFFT